MSWWTVVIASSSFRGNQDGERIARAPRADAHGHAFEPGAGDERLQACIVKAQPAIAQLGPDPGFAMFPQIEDQRTAAGPENPPRFGERPRGVVRVVQRLRQQGDIDRAVTNRQSFERPALPRHVRDLPALRKGLCPRQHFGRPID